TPKTPGDKDKRGVRVKMWQSSAIFQHVLAFGCETACPTSPHLTAPHEVQTRIHFLLPGQAHGQLKHSGRVGGGAVENDAIAAGYLGARHVKNVVQEVSVHAKVSSFCQAHRLEGGRRHVPDHGGEGELVLQRMEPRVVCGSLGGSVLKGDEDGVGLIEREVRIAGDSAIPGC